MGIINKLGNIFKSGSGEPLPDKQREREEAQIRVQKERSDNFLCALNEGDLDARWAAVRSVGDLGEPFIGPLIRGLQDEYWIIRRGSADTLGKIGAPAVGPLILALDEPGDDVRQETIRALQLIGDHPLDLSSSQPATATTHPVRSRTGTRGLCGSHGRSPSWWNA